jgi:polyisoprenoid-binding protein YceI
LKRNESQLRYKLLLVIGFFLILAGSVVHGSVIKLNADKDSSFISYHVYHFFHSVDGTSKNISCVTEIDSATHRIIRVSVKTDANSFNSGNEARDKTVAKTIESDKYPEITFESDSVFYDSDTTMSVEGRITFHGVKKEIIAPATISSKDNQIICDGSIQLNFDEFNVKRPSLLFIPIGNEFIIRFHIVFNR